MPEGTVTAITVQGIEALEKFVEEELVKEAVAGPRKFAAKREDIVVRDLLPGTDLKGISGDWWAQTVNGGDWTTVYSGTVSEKKVIAIYGFANKAATPRTIMVRFGTGAGPAYYKDQWQVEHAYVKQEPVIYTKKPIIYAPNESFRIEFYAVTSGMDEVILIGKVAEPRGELIK
ncbi:MAG: hypothetical protein DRO09_00175 [Thermoprotei archaeon]|nr:MAG: hypothetical protein DRO09_00175 [Thermoprotei archaeon]